MGKDLENEGDEEDELQQELNIERETTHLWFSSGV